MVKTVEPPQFNAMTMAYFEYLRRYRQAGEPDNRLRLPLFAKYLQRLSEGEFFLSALVAQHKKSSKAYTAVLKDQAELRARLFITDTLPELEEALVPDAEPAAKPQALRKPRVRKPKESGGGMVLV